MITTEPDPTQNSPGFGVCAKLATKPIFGKSLVLTLVLSEPGWGYEACVETEQNSEIKGH